MQVIVRATLAQDNMSKKCFIAWLNTTAPTERSDPTPSVPPRCLCSPHPSFLRRKVARQAALPGWIVFPPPARGDIRVGHDRRQRRFLVLCSAGAPAREMPTTLVQLCCNHFKLELAL